MFYPYPGGTVIPNSRFLQGRKMYGMLSQPLYLSNYRFVNFPAAIWLGEHVTTDYFRVALAPNIDPNTATAVNLLRFGMWCSVVCDCSVVGSSCSVV